MISEEEKKSVEGLLTFATDKKVFFDIGSHKGTWTDIILNEFKEDCQLHLFDANEKLTSYCEVKYDYNDNVSINYAAVTNKKGLSNFHLFQGKHSELSSLYINSKWEDLPQQFGIVQNISIDYYCKLNNIDYIDFIKIDVEGAEALVIEGAKEMIEQDKIGIIQLEYSPHYKCGKHTFQQIIDFIKPLGYKVYSYKNENWDEVDIENFVEDFRFENFFITKYNIHNYSGNGGGWLYAFKESVEGLPKFKFMLEVGSFEGFTAKYMCENMLEEGERMIVVDPLQDYYTEETKGVYPDFKDLYQRFLRNTKGLPIELRRQDSRIALPEMHEYRFEFAYIDGEHDISYTDAVNVFPIVKEEGFILFDDANGWSDAATAGIQRFLREYEGYYEIIKNGYQLLIKKIKNYHGTI